MPMKLYVDSSVVASILLKEVGASSMGKELERCDAVFSSHLLEAEVMAAAAREGRDFETVNALIAATVALVMPKRSLTMEYQEIYRVGYCRGADALHLATALENQIKDVQIVTNRKLNSMLEKAGTHVTALVQKFLTDLAVLQSA